MTKRLLIVAISLLMTMAMLACGDATASPADNAGKSGDEIEWLRDYDQAKALAAERGQIIMVDVYTDWCKWCVELDEKVFPDPAMVKLAGNMISLKLDAEDDAVGTMFAKKFGVDSYPTIMFITADEQEVDRISGFMPAEAFAAEVTRIQSGEGTWLDVLEKVDHPESLTAEERVDIALKLIQRKKTDMGALMAAGIDLSQITNPESKERAYMVMTDIAIQKEDFPKAKLLLTDLLKEFPQSPNAVTAQYYMVVVNFYAKDKAGAVASLELLKKNHPGETKMIQQAEGAVAQMQ
jgi:thioredoxin-related protein